MFCRNCGKEIDGSLEECSFCKEPIIKIKIKNYLLESILAAIFCNIIFGLIALNYSIKVKHLTAAGEIKEAIKASKIANRWLVTSAIAFFIGIFLIIYLVIHAV